MICYAYYVCIYTFVAIRLQRFFRSNRNNEKKKDINYDVSTLIMLCNGYIR